MQWPSVLALLTVSLCGCASAPDLLLRCQDEGTLVADDAELPWGVTAATAASRAVGSTDVALSADLDSGAWASPGSLSTVQSGDALAFIADTAGCPHDEWIEVPLTLTLTSDDGALSEAVSATGTVWGESDGESEFVAKLSFFEFGEPFASIVAEASTAADAEGCVVGAPYDTVLLQGSLGAGVFALDIYWSCDDGNEVRAADVVYPVDYVAVH